MFTGLVQAVGRVAAISHEEAGVRFTIDPGEWGHTPVRGDSVAVSGCCLTVTNSPRGWLRGSGKRRTIEFFAVPETLGLTTLESLRVGSAVNLEHAATLQTFLGGHLVQGHVDGVGRVARVEREGEWRVSVEMPGEEFAQYVTPKGSICIDGVSLTVAGLWKKGRRDGFDVALIPETLAKTTLGELRPGYLVNLEADVIAKTVVHWAANFGKGAGKKAGAVSRKRSRTR